MKKIDYKKELKKFYQPSTQKVEIVDVPRMTFLMVDGKGDPNTSQGFQEAVEVLFGLSYTIKFMVKKGKEGIDYAVMPLEGLWWVNDMTHFSVDRRDDWKWTVMMMQPEFVTHDLIDRAIEQAQKKKRIDFSKVRFEAFAEGKSAQILHIGPFSEEGPTIEKIHHFIKENGFTLTGKHHEIYLSDIRKSAPEKWKTIIRQPMK
jgi:hypothetical protein